MGKPRQRELGQVLGQRRRPCRLLALQGQLGIDRVPDDDHVSDHVEAAHDFLLGLFLLLAQHPIAPKPEPTAQRVQLLALVELGVDASAQGLRVQVAQDEGVLSGNGKNSTLRNCPERWAQNSRGRLVYGGLGLG